MSARAERREMIEATVTKAVGIIAAPNSQRSINTAVNAIMALEDEGEPGWISKPQRGGMRYVYAQPTDFCEPVTILARPPSEEETP